MKRVSFKLLILLLIMFPSNIRAFTVSVFIPQETKSILSPNFVNILQNKMENIIKAGGAFSGNGSRYILVPKITIIDETSTSTIPSQDVIKINIHYCVGDGVDGKLYDSTSIDYKGVGDSRTEALHSAINKIKANSPQLKELIESAERNVTAYYDQNGKDIIKEATRYAASQDYEKAISILIRIPSGCKYYEESQNLSLDYAGKILNRDNLIWLNKAKVAWASSHDINGAKEAERCLNQIVVNNKYILNEVNSLVAEMNEGMKENQRIQAEIQMRQIDSETQIQIAKTEANAKIVSSIADGAASVISNLIRLW